MGRISAFLIISIILIAGCIGGKNGEVITANVSDASSIEGYVFVPSYSLYAPSQNAISSPSGYEPLAFAYVGIENSDYITQTDKNGYYKIYIYDKNLFNTNQTMIITKNIGKDSTLNITNVVNIEARKNTAFYMELQKNGSSWLVDRMESAASVDLLSSLPQSTQFDTTSSFIAHPFYYNSTVDSRTYERTNLSASTITASATSVYNVASVATGFILFNSVESLKIAKSKSGDIHIVESVTYSDLKPKNPGMFIPYTTNVGDSYYLFGTGEVKADILSANNSVSVPAGDFTSCIKIQFTKGSSKDIAYWAPILGPVKITSYYNDATAETYVLKSATVNSVDYPRDNVAPSPPVNLVASVNVDNQVVLNWTNPTDTDLAGVRIIRKTTGYPSGYNDGSNIYSGTASTFTDTTVSVGSTYYYTVYAYDEVPNYSDPDASSRTTVTVSESDASLIAASITRWKTEIQKTLSGGASISTIMAEYDSAFSSNLGHNKTTMQGTIETFITNGSNILLSNTTPSVNGTSGESTITGQMDYTSGITLFKYNLKFILKYTNSGGTWKITGTDFVEEDFYPATQASFSVSFTPDFDYKVSSAPTSSMNWVPGNISSDSNKFKIDRYLNSTWYNGALTDVTGSSSTSLSGKFVGFNSGTVYRIRIYALSGSSEIAYFIRYCEAQ